MKTKVYIAQKRKIKVENIEDVVGRVVVPVEQIKRIRSGKQRVLKKKLK